MSADKKSIEVAVRLRESSAAVCSRLHLPVSAGRLQAKFRRDSGAAMRRAAAPLGGAGY
jgi:hypothetical protein